MYLPVEFWNPFAPEGAEATEKSFRMILRMRYYALLSAGHDDSLVSYLIALLEWMLPVVCYTVSPLRKRLSMIASALVCEKLKKLIA